jgi:hypothetical protein
MSVRYIREIKVSEIPVGFASSKLEMLVKWHNYLNSLTGFGDAKFDKLRFSLIKNNNGVEVGWVAYLSCKQLDRNDELLRSLNSAVISGQRLRAEATDYCEVPQPVVAQHVCRERKLITALRERETQCVYWYDDQIRDLDVASANLAKQRQKLVDKRARSQERLLKYLNWK